MMMGVDEPRQDTCRDASNVSSHGSLGWRPGGHQFGDPAIADHHASFRAWCQTASGDFTNRLGIGVSLQAQGLQVPWVPGQE